MRPRAAIVAEKLFKQNVKPKCCFMHIIDQGRIFADRHEAGFEVGKLLAAKYEGMNALVLGIPRGGVVIAYEVARILEGELSVVISKKLPHPLYEEFAIGAAAEDGSVYLTSAAKQLDEQSVSKIFRAQQKEIQSRVQRFRRGRPLPSMDNRIVIIADDGIATGSTLVPALKLCKRKNAAKIIVAVPVSGHRYLSEIDRLSDEVVVAEQPEDFQAVGQVYEDFHHLYDEEVIQLMDDFEREYSKTSY
jgi:putative phosphoribosyl transferase